MKVNFIDLKAQYLSIKSEIDKAIQSVINSSSFSSGPFVKSFEENFAKAHEAKYCAGVNSGTSALHIAMWALGVGRDDEVIVPANTFFATPEAVSLCGATPVFVDCEPDYYNIDAYNIEEAITDKTKAIIAVHLYGQPARLDEIKAIAEKHNLFLLEDCAQAHLAEYKGIKVGTFGICGCFSFYPGKNLGAYGEAGAVITDDEDLFKKILSFRDHGSQRKYYHDFIGQNYRMDGIQGAVLETKIRHLKEWTERRRENTQLYRDGLNGIGGIVLPIEMLGVWHVYHLFVIRTRKRDELRSLLNLCGISTGIHYPVPCHLQQAYREADECTVKLSVSERLSNEILSLPIYPELSELEIEFICDKIREFYNNEIG